MKVQREFRQKLGTR